MAVVDDSNWIYFLRIKGSSSWSIWLSSQFSTWTKVFFFQIFKKTTEHRHQHFPQFNPNFLNFFHLQNSFHFHSRKMYSHFNSTSPTKTASAPNSTTLSRTRFVSSTTRSSWSTRIYPSPLTSSTGVRFWAPPSRPVPSFKPCAINRRASDPPRDLHRPLHKSPTLAHALSFSPLTSQLPS